MIEDINTSIATKIGGTCVLTNRKKVCLLSSVSSTFVKSLFGYFIIWGIQFAIEMAEFGNNVIKNTSFLQRWIIYLISILNFKQKWNTVRKFNMHLLKLTGTHIALPEWKKSARLLIPMWLATNMFTLIIYTAFHYRDDLIKSLEPTTLISFVLPVSYP